MGLGSFFKNKKEEVAAEDYKDLDIGIYESAERPALLIKIATVTAGTGAVGMQAGGGRSGQPGQTGGGGRSGQPSQIPGGGNQGGWDNGGMTPPESGAFGGGSPGETPGRRK